ncbi:radical SAM/SPASM domain-containing protein [Streptomyces polychromogenes]|uniref:Radical SAM/SPASM domain-containing protein n=1 Tax=Streptomyces polychromogenes TaxID=67342 RepID=A0ABN0V4N3_9ACTN
MMTSKGGLGEPHSGTRIFLEPEALTILGTYKCTAACENCCFGSNPFITKRLDLAQILSFVEEGARYPTCKLVVFSGGECFLLGKDLVSAVKYAASLGMHTRCVTNGFWARRIPHGRRRLRELVEAGLAELNISTGDFHQRWVPQESVINAACIAAEFGLKPMIMVEVRKDRSVTSETFAADPRIRELIEGEQLSIIESPWMPMDYRENIEQPQHRLLNRRTLHLRGGCTSVLKTIVVTPDQRVGYCCGLTRELIPELNADWAGGTLDDILTAGVRDFMKVWLFVDGPERILAWAASKDSRIDWEDRYAHHCHSCLALFDDPLVREAIRANYRERVEDVLARYVALLRTDQSVHYVDAEN